MDMNVSECPLLAGYLLTEKAVEGGKSDARDLMEQLVDQFIKTNGLGYLFADGSGNVALMAEKRHIEGGVRGTGRVYRIDIQGPQGKHAARIAYQISGHVNAQIVLPLKARVSEEAFKQAFLDSFDKHVVVEFRLEKPEETTEPVAQTLTKSKKRKGPRSSKHISSKASSSKPSKDENSVNAGAVKQKPAAADSAGPKKLRVKHSRHGRG